MNQQKLIKKINDAAKIIANTRYGSSNYIFCSKEIADVLNNLNQLTPEEIRKRREKKLERLFKND